MSPERQRIAIGEACGWRWKDNGKGYVFMVRPGAENSFLLNGHELLCNDALITVPDYPADLNAMHAAERKHLTSKQRGLFRAFLKTICADQPHENYNAIHATAAQRAEAFLRTIGKWEDELKKMEGGE